MGSHELPRDGVSRKRAAIFSLGLVEAEILKYGQQAGSYEAVREAHELLLKLAAVIEALDNDA